jgi:carboxyl-terminal processing protease
VTKPILPFQQSFTRMQFNLLLAFTVLLMITAFILGFTANQLLATRNVNFPVFAEAHKIYLDNAYEGIPTSRKIEYGMIKGMLSAANDPYTSFIEPPQNELQTNQLQGKFGGIGVRIDKDTEGNVLLYPLPDSPARKAGLLDGDHLISVGDMVIHADTSLDEIQAAIRGPIKSSVVLVIERGPEKEILDFTFQRAEVAAPSVTYNLVPSNHQVGVIQMNIMAASSAEEIVKAITELTNQGAHSFIIDLRNNGGGLVDAGVDCAKLFLNKDLVVIEEKFRDEEVKSFKTFRSGPYLDVPIVFLVNQNTASAAEIFAGALQHHHRAQIIGARTFGKDSIQKVFDLSDGSSIHVSAGKWWIQGQPTLKKGEGLEPDILMSPDEANAPTALDEAVKLLIP